jgi:hypothetical protein
MEKWFKLVSEHRAKKANTNKLRGAGIMMVNGDELQGPGSNRSQRRFRH